jgi:hypothetical protein
LLPNRPYIQGNYDAARSKGAKMITKGCPKIGSITGFFLLWVFAFSGNGERATQTRHKTSFFVSKRGTDEIEEKD